MYVKKDEKNVWDICGGMQMNEKININEIMSVEQLPKIFYELEKIGEIIDNALVGINDMVCDEDNKKEVKKRKQEITAFKNLMESKRKEIKNQVMEKYNEFNKKYEEEVKVKLENAENILTEKYTAIEIQQKQEKEKELREFVEQHCKDKNVHIEFERIGLNITLSASIKSLKEQALVFIDKVVSDLKLIELEEYKDEILLEYNQNLNFAEAKLIVADRHKKLEEIKEQQKEVQLRIDEEAKIVEQVEEVIEEITPPVEIETTVEDLENEKWVLSFTVKGPKEKLKKLKKYIIELGLEWE